MLIIVSSVIKNPEASEKRGRGLFLRVEVAWELMIVRIDTHLRETRGEISCTYSMIS